MSFLYKGKDKGKAPSQRLTNRYMKHTDFKSLTPNEVPTQTYTEGPTHVYQGAQASKKDIKNSFNNNYVPKESGWTVQTKHGASVTDANFSDGAMNKQDMKRIIRVDNNQKWKNLFGKLTGKNKGTITAFKFGGSILYKPE